MSRKLNSQKILNFTSWMSKLSGYVFPKLSLLFRGKFKFRSAQVHKFLSKNIDSKNSFKDFCLPDFSRLSRFFLVQVLFPNFSRFSRLWATMKFHAYVLWGRICLVLTYGLSNIMRTSFESLNPIWWRCESFRQFTTFVKLAIGCPWFWMLSLQNEYYSCF